MIFSVPASGELGFPGYFLGIFWVACFPFFTRSDYEEIVYPSMSTSSLLLASPVEGLGFRALVLEFRG